MTFTVRPANPDDAEQLTRLAEAVSAEPEAWLISADGEDIRFRTQPAAPEHLDLEKVA